MAFNHLLNEIQAICYVIDEEANDLDRYKEIEVTKFLRNQTIPHGILDQIRNLFDRRNKNPVSHADPIAWVVTKEEYMSYRGHVGDCLKHLLGE